MTEEGEGKAREDGYGRLLETLDRLHREGSLSVKRITALEDYAVSLASRPRRRVVCLETGEVFDSVSEAARAAGVSQSNISACLNGKARTAAGLHWAPEGSDVSIEGIEAGRKLRVRRVVCLETGDVYESASAAARATGLGQSNIASCLNGKTLTAGGLHWAYDGAHASIEGIEAGRKRGARHVVCLETGEVFDNAAAAARAVGTSPQNIAACLKGRTRTAGGLHWVFEGSGATIEGVEASRRTRPVLCVETGDVYGTVAEAARATGANRSSICCCLGGKRRTAGGFHWECAG